MRRIISILLIFLVIFNSFGFVIVYFHISILLKLNASQSLNNFSNPEGLMLIILPEKNPYCNEALEFINERELKYAGSLYDIYKEVTSGDSLYLYCLRDDDENFLDHIFYSFLNTKKEKGNFSLLNILSNIILSAIISDLNSYRYYDFMSGYAFSEKFNIILLTGDKLKPVPKTFS